MSTKGPTTSHATRPNRIAAAETVAEEREERQDAASEQLAFLKAKLPILLKRLAKIPDPRNPRKIRHKHTVLLVYGILMFVYQMASRRQANARMTAPQVREHLQLIFPDLRILPHQDTLNRLLQQIDVDDIQTALQDLIGRLIRQKKFARYLVEKGYPVAIDGTQKLIECLRNETPDPKWQKRTLTSGDTQYYVYVLEANLAFPNGMSLPLMTEFLDATQGDVANDKQDCEQRAFMRLSQRLKQVFPRLELLVLLDGLYATGPVMARCRAYGWDFMIVLKDESLRSVWDEYHGLLPLHKANRVANRWGDRDQTFRWVNQIEYRYGKNQRRSLIVHVVVCDEQWTETRADGTVEAKSSRHAWLSSQPLNRGNLHARCNLAARHRWAIEAGFLVEKTQGYQYEHPFSHDWNALRGYHYLMRIGHALNVLLHFSSAMVPRVRLLGVRGLLRYLWETISAPWLDLDAIRRRLAMPFQLRLE